MLKALKFIGLTCFAAVAVNSGAQAALDKNVVTTKAAARIAGGSHVSGPAKAATRAANAQP